MNRLAILLAFPAALFLASPSIAQDRIAPKEETKEELKKKTDEQLKEELKGLSKDISKGMGKVHKGLEKAALPRRKADELRSEFNRMLNKLRKGEADELHGGMKEYLDANPAKLAELLKINKEDAKSLLEDDSKLLKRLAENAEKTSDLFKDVDTLNDVLKRQADLEKSMEEVRKSMERGRATEGSIERVLDILQESERRKKP